MIYNTSCISELSEYEDAECSKVARYVVYCTSCISELSEYEDAASSEVARYMYVISEYI